METTEDLNQIQIDFYKARRAAALGEKPVLSDAEICSILGIPISSWFPLKKTLKIKSFKIGKRSFVRQADFRKWIDEQAGADRNA